MSQCCDKNPLQRSGTNQAQRLLAGLHPGYVSVDERDFADWIFFADQFSYYIKYYYTASADADSMLKNDQDWKAFFSTGISAVLGSVAVQDADIYRRSVKKRFDFIRDADNAGNTTALKQKLNELFSVVLSLAAAFDNYLRSLPDKNPDGETNFLCKTNLLNSIQTKLAPALKRLLSYYKAADTIPAPEPDLLEPSDMSGWKVLNRQVESAEITIAAGLSKHWVHDSPAANWNAYVTGIAADNSIYGLPGWTDEHKIIHAVNHNLFSSVFDQFLQVFSRTVQDAEKALLLTLDNWKVHPPHYALFLSFLKLFRFAQSHLNTITKRHLDFYYKEVLRLKPKDAIPDQANIITGLAKPVQQYALKQGTEFKAGKDSAGKEVTYLLNKETTFNKAQVAHLKAVYKGNLTGKDDHRLTEEDTSPMVNNRGRLFAAPVINSGDGLGGKLKSANNEWHPFAGKKYKDGKLQDIISPNAQIGFAIASHYLYLCEGERTVRVKLSLSNNSLLSNTNLEGYLTTEKEWYKIPSLSVVSNTGTAITEGGTTTAATEISFTIPGDAPAITNYNAALHGGTFAAAIPVLKIYLKNEDGTTAYPYENYKGITVSKVEIKAEVGNQAGYSETGVKQLSLSNDFGPVDASKPFMPFGPQPEKDATFIIGNKEIFSKQNAAVRLNFAWAGFPTATGDIDYDRRYTYTYNNTTKQFDYALSGAEGNLAPSVKAEFLSGSKWNNLVEGTAITALNIFSASTVSTPFIQNAGKKIPDLFFSDYDNEYKTFDAAAVNGFVRLRMEGDFGHKKYLKDLTQHLIEKAGNVSPKLVPQEPVEPYTPVVQSLYISYTANKIEALNSNSKTIFNNRDIQFFHLYPFGEAEQHGYLAGSNSSPYLFPQFSHTSETGLVPHTGEFYIGIENLQEEQAVNILFQLMEGSSDPLVGKPDNHIHWSYLTGNQWLPFTNQQISDATLNLTQSGIITFIIPEGAGTDNTMLPAGYLWLRAAVESAPEAVCKLISVDAQAAVVTFSPNNNAADFLDNALPPGTIAKLKIPDSSVKKINQPYSSFGGRKNESSENFYIRISERLRHKARAITIWDYEHLVLEAFPSVHKVKCLNHTKFETDKTTGQIDYNEMSPGYVTIITIPDLKNRNDANPLRPYTNQDVLTNIEAYLKERTSCHVRLRAKNPRFEEVWVSFKLKLVKGYDDFTFYANKLAEEITQFLTPWAYGGNTDIQFGGKILKSDIINFIEERPYVDFITEVKMYHSTNPDNESTDNCSDASSQLPGASGDLEEVEASTARSILVSVPASKHIIDPVPAEQAGVESPCPGIIYPPINNR